MLTGITETWRVKVLLRLKYKIQINGNTKSKVRVLEGSTDKHKAQTIETLILLHKVRGKI